MIHGIVASQPSSGTAPPPGPTYATFDPANKHTEITLSAGDLLATKSSGGALRSVRSTLGVSTGKHYFEIKSVVGATSPFMLFGVGTTGVDLTSFVGNNASGFGYYEETGQKYTNNTPAAFGAAWAADNDVIGIALDMDAGKVWFSKNGVWQGSGDPAAGTNPAFSGLTGTLYAYASLYRGVAPQHQALANFGASAFAHTVPSGFRAGLYQ